MKTIVSLLLIVSIGFSPVRAFGVEWPTDEELKGAEKKTLDVGEEPLELDEITVIGIQFTFEQETALRLVRQALSTHRSHKRKDKDVWTCRFRAPVGARRKHLECARNGDLMAHSLNATYPIFEKDRPANQQFGTIMISQRPVNEKKFRAMLEDLPGSAELDKEFVSMALAGMRPPRNIPSDEELDDFAAAYQAVTELDKSGADDDKLMAAISEYGLSVNRYNRLVELIETYQSLENEVAFRLGTLKRPND